MNLFGSITVCLACVFMSLPAFAGFEVGSDQSTLKEAKKPLLLAKRPRKARKSKKKGVRERHISREGKQRSSDSKNIDFDAADIGGARKAPMSSLINQNKADKNYDFVKIRLRWHPEMIQSASSLSAGGK